MKPTKEVMMSWQNKVSRVIQALCQESYDSAQTSKSGKRYKKHHPYTIPTEAEALVNCLDTNDEERAKAMMLYNYQIKQLSL